MSREVELLCLANSKKERGRCVAGVDLDTEEWIRPVPGTEKNELHPRHYMTENNSAPEPLDIVRVYLEEARPKNYHPENWLITNDSWEIIQRNATDRVPEFINSILHSGPQIFGSRQPAFSTSVVEESPLTRSLTLIRPEKPQFFIRERDGRSNQPRTRFELNGTRYDLPITDPEWKKKIRSEDILPQMDLKYEPASAYVDSNKEILYTISLSEPHEGEHYKLVPAIIPIPEQKIGD